MGEVYRARDSRLGREVAVKVLAGELDDAAAVRFERECAAMGSLSGHPHIVTIFDSGIARDEPYIIMESLPGGSLHDVLGQGPLSWVDVSTTA
jgi:serine/threonine protein kinase